MFKVHSQALFLSWLLPIMGLSANLLATPPASTPPASTEPWMKATEWFAGKLHDLDSEVEARTEAYHVAQEEVAQIQKFLATKRDGPELRQILKAVELEQQQRASLLERAVQQRDQLRRIYQFACRMATDSAVLET